MELDSTAYTCAVFADGRGHERVQAPLLITESDDVLHIHTDTQHCAGYGGISRGLKTALIITCYDTQHNRQVRTMCKFYPSPNQGFKYYVVYSDLQYRASESGVPN